MELHDLTAVQQAHAIRSGSVSSVELTQHYLARAHRLGDVVGAFVEMTDELALDQARDVDARVARGETDDFSPLTGVVVPVKDLHRFAGVRTRFGSTVVDVVPTFDDDVVARMRAAGTVMIGKTSAPEFGLPAYTESDVSPWSRTPWDLSRSAGGSSGGAAAAVASGLAPVAHGSDGGGSIRIPASACGLVGIKPSRGLVSNGPLPEGIARLGVHGPLARNVADAATLLDVMADRDYDQGFRRATEAEPAPLRIGRYCTPVIAEAELDPECLAAFEQASQLLAGLGHDVVDIEPPLPRELVEHFVVVWSAGASMIPLPPEAEPQLRPLTRWLRDTGRSTTPEQVERAVQALVEHAEAAVAATAEFDAVLTPTLAQLPAPIGSLRDDDDPAGDFDAQCRFTPFTSPYNMTGQPAVSLPLHWTSAGLPVGIQLVGRRDEEALLLSLAAQVERACPWSQRRPEVW